jgi:hypothetical protein
VSAYHNIPTAYKGINFRSRLEAKYAVMFDELGWRWEYEPIDLKGWIPDFVIEGVKPIYVEVKPIFKFDESLGAEIANALALKWEDDYPGDFPHEALIVGASLPQNNFSCPGLGWLWEGYWSPSHVFELPAGGYDLCHDTNTYRGRITGYYDSGYLLDAPDLAAMWAKAGNAVQWQSQTSFVRPRTLWNPYAPVRR